MSDTKQQASGKHAKSKPEPDSRNEQEDLKRKAIKFKAFQFTFAQRDGKKKDLSDREIMQRLRESKHLESSYYKYLKDLEKRPNKKIVFPWENPFNRFLFLLSFWVPRVCKWICRIVLTLLVINYIPGPTQHIIEIIIARTLYDVSPVQRLPETLASYAHSAKIISRDGEIIKSYGKREVTARIPAKVKTALLACEDHYLLPHEGNPWYVNAFLIHAGVSWPNLVGAVKDTLLGRRRGASTVIMQNAKKILGNSERTIAHKLEEIIVAYMMVARFGKEKNLDFYINTVPVGSNMYGFPAAAQNYFKKNLTDLTMQQLVAIASFIPNHNRCIAFYQVVKGKSFTELEPRQLHHAKAAMAKINLALGYLAKMNEISAADYERWLLDDEESIRAIGFRDFRSPLYGEEEWTSWNVIREVCSRNYTVNNSTVSGSRLLLDVRGDVIIETSVDVSLVEKSKEVLANFLSSPTYHKILLRKNKNLWKKDRRRYLDRNQTPPYRDFKGFMTNLYNNINAGIIIVNQQGEIVSYVGGKEFIKNSDSHNQEGRSPEHPLIIDLMNRQATLTPASTIKPVISYFAMTAGNATLETPFADKPLEFKYVKSAGKKIWLPRNWYPYDREGKGRNHYLGRKYSLLEAQVLSVNTIFARLYSNRRLQSSMLMAFDQIGLKYNRQDARYWPFGIGAGEVPVQQWLGVYNAFLDGYYRQPAFVKRILINGETIYGRVNNPDQPAIPLFDAKKERNDEMRALYEVCNRGTGAAMKNKFKYHRYLVSGKTGTAPGEKSTVFISHFNPYQDRRKYKDKNLTMIVLVTTNRGGIHSVGSSTQGPVKIAGEIYNFLFNKELQEMIDREIEEAKRKNSHFRNNHIYWANVNRYMKRLLTARKGKHYIYENIIGIDAFQEALRQILNSNNKIYTGRDDLFEELVRYYDSQEKVVRIK